MHLTFFVDWTVMTRLTKFHGTKKQKVATFLLLDKLHTQDFAGPHSRRASRVLGPISRHRIADILHHMNIVSRASRPGYSLASFASNVMGSALHGDFTLQKTITPAVWDAQMNLIPSLITMGVPRLYNIFLSFWRRATILPPRNCLLQDLIFQVFLRSLQYGIVVLGFLDAFCLRPS